MHAAVSVALLWVSVAQPSFELFKTDTPDRPFAVMVHRGRMDLAPENTAPAIEACIERGYEVRWNSSRRCPKEMPLGSVSREIGIHFYGTA